MACSPAGSVEGIAERICVELALMFRVDFATVFGLGDLVGLVVFDVFPA